MVNTPGNSLRSRFVDAGMFAPATIRAPAANLACLDPRMHADRVHTQIDALLARPDLAHELGVAGMSTPGNEPVEGEPDSQAGGLVRPGFGDSNGGGWTLGAPEYGATDRAPFASLQGSFAGIDLHSVTGMETKTESSESGEKSSGMPASQVVGLGLGVLGCAAAVFATPPTFGAAGVMAVGLCVGAGAQIGFAIWETYVDGEQPKGGGDTGGAGAGATSALPAGQTTPTSEGSSTTESEADSAEGVAAGGGSDETGAGPKTEALTAWDSMGSGTLDGDAASVNELRSPWCPDENVAPRDQAQRSAFIASVGNGVGRGAIVNPNPEGGSGDAPLHVQVDGALCPPELSKGSAWGQGGARPGDGVTVGGGDDGRVGGRIG